MSKIVITEVDQTTVQSNAVSSTDVVYVPGFSVKVSQDDSIIGQVGYPVLCNSINQFETYFGSRCPVFEDDQLIPQEFSSYATEGLPDGTKMFVAGEGDPGYIFAKEILAMGLPVLYERVNSGTGKDDITVDKMYSFLSKAFTKEYDTEVASKPFESDSVSVNTSTFVSQFPDAGNYVFTYSIDPVDIITVEDKPDDDVVAVDTATFIAAVNEPNTYTFTYVVTENPEDRITVDEKPDAEDTVAVDATTFITAVDNQAGIYAFTYVVPEGVDPTPSWQLGGTDVDLDTYGITRTGDHVLVDGDRIVITLLQEGQAGTGSWQLDETDIDLATYGITIRVGHVLVDGDTIVIKYEILNGSWRYDGAYVQLAYYGITYSTTEVLYDGAELKIYLSVTEPKLLDKDTYQFKYLTTGGYPTFEYNNKSISQQAATLCARRGDAIVLIDALDNPYRTLTGFGSIYTQATQSINMLSSDSSSYATMFIPSIEVGLINTYVGTFNGYNITLLNKKVMPASFAYLSCLATSIKTNANWLAIAGAIRGKVTGLSSVRTNKLLTNALAEAYQPDTALAINPITQINPYGYCIWGNRTLVDNSLKQGTTATSFLNIRNLCSDIKKQLYVACQSLMFEQNTDILWINFLALVTPLLDQMVSGYGITNYKIIKLPPSDRTKINVKIRIYPIYAVESFDITLYINDQGAYMDEE